MAGEIVSGSSVTSGFFNSLGGDRKYDATQMSSIFDGIITDGVIKGYGDAFARKSFDANNGTITIGTGRAWFNHTWLLNSANLTVNLTTRNASTTYYDCIYIEVNLPNRRVTINKVSQAGSRPTLTRSDSTRIYQYPLYYIYRPSKAQRSSPDLQVSDITNVIGVSPTPYSTAPYHTFDAGQYYEDFRAQLDTYLSDVKIQTETFMNDTMSNYIQQTERSLSDMNAEFHSWFDSLQIQLDGDVAGHLQNEIDALNEQLETLVTTGKMIYTLNDMADSAILDEQGARIQSTVVVLNQEENATEDTVDPGQGLIPQIDEDGSSYDEIGLYPFAVLRPSDGTMYISASETVVESGTVGTVNPVPYGIDASRLVSIFGTSGIVYGTYDMGTWIYDSYTISTVTAAVAHDYDDNPYYRVPIIGSMEDWFAGATGSIELQDLDTSRVTNMRRTFANNTGTNANLHLPYDTTAVTDMYDMLSGSSFQYIYALTNFVNPTGANGATFPVDYYAWTPGYTEYLAGTRVPNGANTYCLFD